MRLLIILSIHLVAPIATAFTAVGTTPITRCPSLLASCRREGAKALYMSSNWQDDDARDSNKWRSIDEEEAYLANGGSNRDPENDWKTTLSKKQDGTYWSSFEPSKEGDEKTNDKNNKNDKNNSSAATSVLDQLDDEMAAEMWLDTIQSLSAEEVEFNMKEADRADKVRQMQEWGFDSETIKNTLDVATDTSLEKDEVKGMDIYREQSYWDEVDMSTVESHTQVEIDDETGEPIRTQMVYVDEHTCIGCTNCAMIAQSTFFMNPEHGRARVFQQWGDDDETIQIAIETCPVDCIHYVPYDELKSLEIDRRNQNINFKARLVSQAENGNTLSHLVGGRSGANAFTAPQKISGNMGARCNNCPSRGCKNCPMYGVGKNPVFEQRERERKAKLAKRKLLQQRKLEQKSADL